MTPDERKAYNRAYDRAKKDSPDAGREAWREAGLKAINATLEEPAVVETKPAVVETKPAVVETKPAVAATPTLPNEKEVDVAVDRKARSGWCLTDYHKMCIWDVCPCECHKEA